MQGPIAAIVKMHKEIRTSGVPGNQPGMWMRPVSWTGMRAAVDLVNGLLVVVPHDCHPIPFRPTSSDLSCMWELIEPKKVLAEGRLGGEE
jgi:hypothetical protein